MEELPALGEVGLTDLGIVSLNFIAGVCAGAEAAHAVGDVDVSVEFPIDGS
jgi:hypothetical protein